MTVRLLPTDWNIEVSADTGFALDVQEFDPPETSEKNRAALDAICCIVAQAEILGESVEQLLDEEVDAPYAME